jgi:hypothetical protein
MSVKISINKKETIDTQYVLCINTEIFEFTTINDLDGFLNIIFDASFEPHKLYITMILSTVETYANREFPDYVKDYMVIGSLNYLLSVFRTVYDPYDRHTEEILNIINKYIQKHGISIEQKKYKEK